MTTSNTLRTTGQRLHAGRLSVPQKTGSTRTVETVRDGDGQVTSRVRRTVLPGGLRVITEQMAGVRSASIGVWVGVGSRDETPTQHGCSHFLEHLLFKGTRGRSAMDISVALDAVGGEFNAFTAKEYTCFHARVLDVDLPLAVDVLGDMMTDSLIAAADVEAERDVILDEIAMHDDDPDDVVHNLFAEQAWGNGPLGRPIAGTMESITTINREQVLRFYRRHYRPANMVVAAAGNVDHAKAVRLVRRAFGRNDFLSGDDLPLAPRSGDHVRRVHAGTVTARRPLEQVNLVLGVNGLTRNDDRRFALGVLNTALGGGTSSRLFQEVRERRGLAYSVFSFASHHADAGLVGVSVGCLPNKLDDVLVDGPRRAREGGRRRHHRGGARARQGPAPGRAGARPRGLRLADVAAGQGRAGLRRAALARRGDPPGRGRHPRRRTRHRGRAVHAARDPGHRRPGLAHHLHDILRRRPPRARWRRCR